jgi:cation:H+ antiporter
LEQFALFVLGLVLLAVGAPMLVFGSARLDRATGRSPFAVGIVACAFGPCLAGLALNLALVMEPQPQGLSPIRIAVGNIIGNNVASIGFVLGVAVLVRPVAAKAKVHYAAMVWTFVATLLFWFLARNSPLTRTEAGILLGAAVVALAILVREAQRESEEAKAEFASWVPEAMKLHLAVLLALAGLAALIGGAILAAPNAMRAAAYLKMSSLAFGATVAAFGTSLPTLVAAALAARRNRTDLVLGIVVGAAFFNLLLTVGVVAMAQPLIIERSAITEAIPAMALVTFLLFAVLLNRLHAPRWEGAIFLAVYVGFIVWQALKKQG